MARGRSLTPQRLGRSPSHIRLALLKAHLSKFTLVPDLKSPTSVGGSQRRQGLDINSFLRQLTHKIGGFTDPLELDHSAEAALTESVDRYLREAKKFADCFGGTFVLDVLYIIEPQYLSALHSRRESKAAYDQVDHDMLAKRIESLQSELEVSQWRFRIARDGKTRKQAQAEELKQRQRIRTLLHAPCQMEYHLELSGCVGARLGMLARSLRRKLAPRSTRCTISRLDSGQVCEDASKDVRRNFLKKLKKTKHVGFQAGAVRIRLRDGSTSEDVQDVRSSVDQRGRPDFKRRSRAYHPGKWADSSGYGFFDTSGFTANDNEWEIEQLSLSECAPLLSHVLSPNRTLLEVHGQEPENEDTEGLSMLDVYSTPPNSPELITIITVNEDKLDVERMASAGGVSKTYDEYRRLSESEGSNVHRQNTLQPVRIPTIARAMWQRCSVACRRVHRTIQ